MNGWGSEFEFEANEGGTPRKKHTFFLRRQTVLVDLSIVVELNE